MPYLCLNMIFFYTICVLDVVPAGYSAILDWVKYGIYYYETPGIEFLAMGGVILLISVLG